MNFTLRQITKPILRPITLEAAKRHLRVDHAHDDADITDLIDAAAAWCETTSHVALMRQTFRLVLDRFPAGCITLPRPPVHAITQIAYDTDDDADEIIDPSEYRLSADSEPAVVEPVLGQVWPTSSGQSGSVRITYTAGVDDEDDLPAQAKMAVKLLVGHWYANREAVAEGNVGREVELGVTSLLRQIWSGQHWQ